MRDKSKFLITINEIESLPISGNDDFILSLKLMAHAWKGRDGCKILNDDAKISKILGIKKTEFQIKKEAILNGWTFDGRHYIHPTLEANMAKGKKEEPSNGFELELILTIPFEKTILFEKTDSNENRIIWELGVNALSKNNQDIEGSRKFIGKLIKDYSSKSVAIGIQKMLSLPIEPINPQAFLSETLRNGRRNKKKSKGMVAL